MLNTGPLVELKLVTYGSTRNTLLLLSVPPEVVTVTKLVVAPLGTVVLISLAETTVKVAAEPLKLTLLALVNEEPLFESRSDCPARIRKGDPRH
jgi:hypothetical protein